ncbi:hypothetical protein F503_00475 [Ophiostoma piceae UAMH 11346]|uniref:Uncharacterized protein n=1 Tax=Ophiostoma piceae (strain UAMH 11346) TaxID=1262450 RepID=S3CMM5_OPHP1|nr:hypothetical protein F503_00475 [Ophiostoma piceae UAMH 11346]
MTTIHPGSRPRPLWLLGLVLLGIPSVHGTLHNSNHEYAYDDTLGFVQKSWDVLTVDVDVIDIVSIQRIDKRRITAAPLMPDRKLVFGRKASSTCPSSFSECASSLNGGCCPTGFACDVSDCVQTSTASATTTAFACGRAGYTGCGVADGGGCCPSGYTCGRQVCTPPAGATQSQQCPSKYYLCPSSLNFGCCATTMGCALNACYATTPSTIVFTATYTTATDTTGNARITTVTSTTVETPSPPTDTANAVQSGNTDAFVAKFVPTTTAKASLVAASGSSDDNGGGGSGLSPGAIGGLIGGLVALLIAIAVAAFFIIRNVRRTSKEVEEVKRLSGSDKTKPKPTPKMPNTGSGSASKPRASMHQPTPSVINQMEVDDLLEDGQTVAAATSSSGIGHSHPRRQRVSTVTGTSVSNTPDPSFPQPSAYSSPAMGAPAADGESSSGYFDIPQRTHNRPGHYSQDSDPRISIESPPMIIPGRPRIVSNASDASEQPGVRSGAPSGTHTPAVGSPLQPAELGVDGGFIPELPVIQPATRPRPFSSISAVSGLSFAGFSPPLPAQQQQPLMSTDHSSHGYHQRTWSDSSASTTGHSTPQQPPQQQPPASSMPVPLDAVVEEHLHGHYGPAHEVAGQTRAGEVTEQD